MARLERLPEDYRYHITRLSKECLRPMYFSHLFKQNMEGWQDVPTSLAAFAGTCGHSLLTDLHRNTLQRGQTAEFYADVWKKLFKKDVENLCNMAVGRDVDGTGRRSWIDKDPMEVIAHADENADDFGAQIANYCVWWARWMGDPDMLAGVVGSELSFSMPLKSRGGSSIYTFEGLIDLVVRHPKLGLCTLDWKFGTKKRTDTSQATLAMDPQLHQYALACREAELIDNYSGMVHELGVKPDLVGFVMMEDLKPYAKATNITAPGYTTNARKKWVEMMMATSPVGPKSEKPQYQPGDWKGPVLHEDAYTDAQLDSHAQDMCLIAAGTRMGTGLVRHRGDHCTYCFFRHVCLQEWYGNDVTTLKQS